MAVYLHATVQTWIGLSTDTKPAAPTYVGSRFYEYDTGRTYVWNGAAWVIMPVHILNVQGGAYTLQDIMEEHLANLDIARNPQSGSLTCDGTAQVIYEETDIHPFLFYGMDIDFTGANFGAGEDTTIRFYEVIESGGAFRLMWQSIAYLNAALPVPPCRHIPAYQDGLAAQELALPLLSVYGLRITVTQAAIGGGWNVLPYQLFDAKRGG